MSESSRLEGRGTLIHAGDEWVDALSRLARLGKLHENPQDNAGCFVARNFALDEGVLDERAASYREAGGVGAHASFDDWQAAHRRYLEKQVSLDTDDGPPRHLDPKDPDEMPETFRYVDPESPFLGTDPGVRLVRVEELAWIAEKANEDPGRLKALVQTYLSHGTSRQPRDEQTLNAVLHAWHAELDQRPVFAVFWEDVKDLFAAGDQEGWADTLRDRLGLAHLDPETRRASIDVLVFRYPVKDVPRILGTGGKKRPLVTPTVLDGPFSEAFCPSPRGGTTGHVVHLAPAAGILRREVLHPRGEFRASHLWRLGKLTRGVDAASLPDQRAMHLLLVRDETGRDDYARGTDWDLIQ